MQTSDRVFEHIMSAVLEQKQVWEKLQTENRELRQQLLDLRAGRGIFIEIQNQRFEMVWAEASRGGSENAEASQGKRSQTARATRVPAQSNSAGSSGVLEEMLLDELSSAVKNKMSGEGKPSGPLNEEQKATLRRELSGSFLLE